MILALWFNGLVRAAIEGVTRRKAINFCRRHFLAIDVPRENVVHPPESELREPAGVHGRRYSAAMQ
jgi:hypothetical protein